MNSTFYFISFEKFIMFVNLFCFFLFWNRQDKDAQLASFVKKMLYYPNPTVCLSVKEMQNIILLRAFDL